MRASTLLLLLAATAATQEPLWHIVPHDTPAVPRLAADLSRAARIEALIDDLRLATSFESSEAAAQLVKIGPTAVPWLLRHLRDDRETGLEVRGGAFSQVYAHAQVPVPPGRPDERGAIAAALESEIGARWQRVDTGEEMKVHVATVGDFCFLALGRIVNRPYETTRSPTTKLTIVSSPALDPRIAEALHGWWGSGDPRQLVFRSLLDDFHTRGRGSTAFQAAAGVRLLADFPDEAAPIVAKRIADLPWGPPATDEAGNILDDTDGGMLLGALLATGHPSVRAEWLKLLDPKRPPALARAALLAATTFDAEAQARVREVAAVTADLELLATCVAAVPGASSPEILARLGKGLDEHPSAMLRTDLLVAAVVATGDEQGVAILRRHMEEAKETGWVRVLSALDRQPSAALVLALVPPLLEETGPVPAQDLVRVPQWVEAARICDWAASLVAKARPALRFDPMTGVPERDRQIAAMRAALAE